MSNYTSQIRIAATALCFLFINAQLGATTFEDDFENTDPGQPPQAERETLRISDGQEVLIVAHESADPHDGSGERWLRIYDDDATPGLFGPGIRYRPFSAPGKVSFDALLLDGREFPSVVFGGSSKTIFTLILSDGDRTRQLAYKTGSAITSLDYEMELNTWYHIELVLDGDIQLSVKPVGGSASSFTIPAGDDWGRSIAHIDFLLSGSSTGVDGDFLLDNIVIQPDKATE